MFWKLVKHEMKYRAINKGKGSKHRKIGYIYALFFLLIGFVFLTKVALAGKLEPIQIWNVLYGLPFVLIAISRGSVKKELRNNTIGWWLSLPLKRKTLLSAKLVAVIWRSLLIYLFIFAIGIIVFFYALLLEPQFHIYSITSFLKTGIIVGFILIVIGPLVIALGMFIGTLELTEYRYLVSLLWFFFWAAWAFLITTYADVIFKLLQHQSFSLPITAFICWLPCWLIAYGLVLAMSSLLEKKLV